MATPSSPSTGGGFIRAVDITVPLGVRDTWPYSLPAIRDFARRPFHPGVTYFIGENGSGKSTLVEALAVTLGMNAEGGSRNMRFATTTGDTPLAEHMVVERIGRPRTDFFLRAESFFNVGTYIDTMDAKLLESYGGQSLHTRSHGESFIATMLNRFGEQGLYLLDEPESALSFRGCLTLLRLMKDLVAAGSQFVIATHSPYVLAMPDSTIYDLSQQGVRPVTYDEAEPVVNARAFLAAPERYLRHLFSDDD